MQIVAHKPGTLRWMRITGVAQKCIDIKIKERMLRECPTLKTRFPAADAIGYTVFRIKGAQSEIF